MTAMKTVNDTVTGTRTITSATPIIMATTQGSRANGIVHDHTTPLLDSNNPNNNNNNAIDMNN